MSRTVRLGVDSFYAPPLSWIDNGVFCGVARQMMDCLARELDISFDYVPMEQSDLAKAIDAGDLDMRFPDNPAWDQAATKGRFSDVAITYADAFFIKKDVGLPENPCLGILSEYPLPDDPAVEQISGNIRQFNTIEALMAALGNQDMHILFGPIHAFNHALARSPNRADMEQIEWLPVVMDDYLFSFSPDADDLREPVNAWIRAFRQGLSAWNGEERIAL